MDKLARETALVIDQAVVVGTPVNTGRARSGWILSLGAASEKTRPPYAPGKNLGIGESANARGAIEQAQTTIKARAPGQDIYISNNVGHIVPLNNGTSSQAPAGFIEKAVAIGRRYASAC